MARTDQRQFRSPPCAVDRHTPVTFSALFLLRIEATPMFGKPLSECCVFHRSSPCGGRDVRYVPKADIAHQF
jgi:hypothetical protein